MEWLLRIAGYAVTGAVVPYLTKKFGYEIGGAAGLIGGRLLHKASTTWLPKRDTTEDPTKPE